MENKMDFIKSVYENHRIVFWVATYVVVAGIIMLVNLLFDGWKRK